MLSVVWWGLHFTTNILILIDHYVILSSVIKLDNSLQFVFESQCWVQGSWWLSHKKCMVYKTFVCGHSTTIPQTAVPQYHSTTVRRYHDCRTSTLHWAVFRAKSWIVPVDTWNLWQRSPILIMCGTRYIWRREQILIVCRAALDCSTTLQLSEETAYQHNKQHHRPLSGEENIRKYYHININ